MREADVQTKMTDFFNKHEIYYVRVTKASKAGVPDVLACVSGMFVALELKADKGKQSPLQKYNEEQVKKSRGRHYVVTPQNMKLVQDTLLSLKKFGG